ncbi:MAG: molybdopterin-dependent oxidoreductase, partial [Phycisphaerales bacterium]|nr:molybdopterin-dependent oxidoreductase [Phycisphaerales bacterium]
GMLQAMVIDVLLDGGAYVTLSPVVLSRAVIHAAGPYFCPNVQIHGEVRLTNHVPYGAFRGFGAPQTQFAMERQMDRIADALGIDRIELRRRNLLRDGQTTATGQVIRDGVDRVALQDRAVKIADVERTREACKQFNAKHPYLRRGVGLSSFYHGAGFTGSGEVNLASRAEVAGLPDGRIEVRTAQTEMGQGMVTVFTQIVAVYVGYAERDIVIADADTAHVPNSGPTVASRTTMVVGRLVERACDDLRRMLGCEEATGDDLRQAIVRWHESHDDAELIGGAQYVKPSHIHWDDDRYLGDAYAAYAWATNIAQVEVDLRTFMTRVVEFTSVQDVGTVLNDVLARGQIQGGVAQAIGWALSEACAMQNGAMQNAHLTDYIIPTASDLPPIRVWFEQTPYDDGPSGAKGIGELPMNGPAPAILSAISDAVGLDLSHIPVTPETLMEEWLAHERH